MSSQTAKFTFPETLGGQHRISSPKSSGSKQTQSTERCIYVVQEYSCPHHPSLNTPHIFHRIPCPQALLPHTSQTDCENYAHHKDELVQVSRYVLDRGCMECKTLARARRHEEAATHPEIRRKMQELGLGQEDIDHFEKVTSSFPASRRVLELVRAREKSERLRREEVPEEWRRKDGEDEVQNQGEAKQEYELQSKIDNVDLIPPATLVSSIEGPVVEQSDSAEKEHEITQLQPIATKVKTPQRAKILSKRDTSQPSAKPTKLRSLTASIATRVLQRDELMQPQSQVPTHKESTPHPSSKPTELNDPTSDTPPEEELQIAELPERYLEAPTTEASFPTPEPKSHELQATPPNPSPSPKEESPPPEKLTDNIHLSLDEEWDTDEESERVFGEVALAPSFGCQTGDEWIVVGSWEQ
ncbi:uncharacterized protein Bfra_004884 [Botrytis fragariae]|uniref:Uncharacterized protein n=1 Tax=Botrytis fragariae TaxID=1964551 RepID=A0A8H6ATX7_9HELO|nr:uncharacterized protein Bfra_004884 [Botrytis fragariae]KAF5873424.1 hypothetical protein Bfra_004884 [Botrytis fragariae]